MIKGIILITLFIALSSCNSEVQFVYACGTPLGLITVTSDHVKENNGDLLHISKDNAEVFVPKQDCIKYRQVQ